MTTILSPLVGNTIHYINSTNHSPDHLCALLDLCLNTTYFKHNKGFCRQNLTCFPCCCLSVHGRRRAFFTGTTPCHWFRYVDGSKHQNIRGGSVHRSYSNIKYTWEHVTGLLGLCSTHWRQHKPWHWCIQQKLTHTDQYLLSNREVVRKCHMEYRKDGTIVDTAYVFLYWFKDAQWDKNTFNKELTKSIVMKTAFINI